jgi:tungstate transport system substrate-binding protein
MRFIRFALIAMLALPAFAQNRFITVASTTSTEQSGLFPHLLPAFTKATGIDVHVVALGTGQALDLARRGDADVVFVHDRPAEDKFVADGWGVGRRDVMYNDFVIVGPKSDPAKIAGMTDAAAAMRKIAESRQPFVSRGDRSGTNMAELRLWKVAGVAPDTLKESWYKDTGSGMGPALNTAASMDAYILADRGTWLSFRNPRDLVIVMQGDKVLFNPYGVMLVNPAKFTTVKKEDGQKFIDWLVSPEGQNTIASYQIGGKQLFFPDAH